MMKKKLLTLLLVLLFGANGNANTSEVSFPVNDKGIPEITNFISVSLSKEDAYNKMKYWIVSTVQSNQSIYIDDKEKGIVAFKGVMQTKYTYNPFAGQFTENITFDFKMEWEEAKITYTINNFIITKTYVGYGANNRTIGLKELQEQLILDQKSIEEANSSSTLSKKEKKKIIEDSNDRIKDNTETLKKAKAVMLMLVDKLKLAF